MRLFEYTAFHRSQLGFAVFILAAFGCDYE